MVECYDWLKQFFEPKSVKTMNFDEKLELNTFSRHFSHTCDRPLPARAKKYDIFLSRCGPDARMPAQKRETETRNDQENGNLAFSLPLEELICSHLKKAHLHVLTRRLAEFYRARALARGDPPIPGVRVMGDHTCTGEMQENAQELYIFSEIANYFP